MKRLITTLSTISLLLISCQQNLAPEFLEHATPADKVITKSLSTEKVTSDDPIIFLPATDMKAWTDIKPLENRFMACEVPALRLKQMTTEALAKSIINYPLNYIVFAYNEPKQAIDLIIKHSPLHQEFISRTDAAEVLIELYATADLDPNPEKSDFDGNYAQLSYTNSMFLDYFFASKALNNIEDSVKNKLRDAVINKIHERTQDSETFSFFSITPLIIIDKVESLNISSSSRLSPMVILSTSTINTRTGYPIEVLDIEEMSAIEMANITNDLTSQHTSAILRGSSTRKYNCHSYAWYKQEVDNNFWLSSYTLSGVFQLSKYWTHDYYVNCTESEAEKVYYSSEDHSAIKLPEGKYISKWGQGPLMEHEYWDCPYLAVNRVFYKDFNINLAIQGQTNVTLNQDYIYDAIHSSDSPPLDIEWEVRYMDSDYPAPYELYIYEISGHTSVRLNFKDYGLFKIKANAYRDGVLFETTQLNVIARPN